MELNVNIVGVEKVDNKSENWSSKVVLQETESENEMKKPSTYSKE